VQHSCLVRQFSLVCVCSRAHLCQSVTLSTLHVHVAHKYIMQRESTRAREGERGRERERETWWPVNSYEEEDTCHTSYEEEDTCHTSPGGL
jgi:hypothetical protein